MVFIMCCNHTYTAIPTTASKNICSFFNLLIMHNGTTLFVNITLLFMLDCRQMEITNTRY